MTMTNDDTEVLRRLEPADGTPSIYGQVAAITAGLGRIAKSGKGPAAQGGYAFMPVDAIVAKLNELLVEHGVIVGTDVLKEKLAYDSSPEVALNGQPTGRVNTKSRARVRIRYSFVSVLDGSRHEVVTVGEAHDVADKALGKAETAAYKKALLRTFTVVSGEPDPDSEDGTGPASEGVPSRRNRGQQRMDKARVREAAPVTPMPKVPAPEPEPTVPAPTIEQPTVGEPEEEDVRGQTEEEAAAEERMQDRAEARAYNEDVRGGQTEAEAAELAARTGDTTPRRRKQPRTPTAPAPADEPEPSWSPDADDVAYAEANAPAARTPEQPKATQAESKSESLADLKGELRRAWSSRGLTRDQVNELGTAVTGKPLTQWMLNVSDLRRVLTEVEKRAVVA